ncbi:unnamed protein product (macronuclear) [Paramecium tetraurelia]|uniref:PIPK domain-containing protein n=1 Tax=Paramecium tetraurelia TaxID=5888 RepID=A0DW93_PARTE|nr:uncharacterized protein GSPATT00020951001 [Paramecium tetraurelia]CAK87310.1 unnamed protein product [Paramecium tetraurelia]|eukprot:XP_001454707.1 hypothetical protein (macronuclear) [Paramecium tetraurelia strain d4-2]
MSQVKGIYSDSEVVDCNSGLSNEELSQAIRLQTIDQYIFLIFRKQFLQLLAIIAFILTMIIMLSFMIYPKTWKMPGDIIFFISFCEAILCVHWFSTCIYFIINESSPLSDDIFCQINSIVSIFAGAGEITYNLIFCLYVRITLKDQFATKKKLRLILHVIAWFTMISVTLIAKIFNYNGLSLFGTCSLKYNPGFNFAGLFLVFVNTFMSVYTMLYIKKAVPENQRYLNLIGKVTRYYSSYITAQFCIQLTQAISYILVGLNCTKFQKGWLLIFITIENSAKLCTPFVLSILRLRDPTINRQILLIWKRLSSKSEVGSSLLSEEQNLVVIAKTLLIDKVNTIVYSIQQIFQQDNYIENASKGSYLLKKNHKVNNQTSEIQSKQIQEIQDKITEEEINEQAQFVIPPEQDLEIELRLMASTIIIYAPKVFQKLRKKDRKINNYSQSFDPISNQEQINSFKGPDGGKGGAFFFFTFDNKLLIKTIVEQELLIIQKNLGRYFLHLNRNESLISPIYGIFKFVLQNGQESQIFIVMRNALQIPSSYVMRTYDLKGSEYQRKVLKQNDFTKDLTKTTLKDIDFKEEEGKLFIPEKFKDRLKNSLIQDSKFFSELNLMDYSLLIIKMNWSSYLQIQPQIDFQIFKFFNSELSCIPSIKEQGVYYHIAIIDYLQEWNAEKRIEQVTKKALNVKIDLDTSAQNPQEYTKRFIEKIVFTII